MPPRQKDDTVVAPLQVSFLELPPPFRADSPPPNRPSEDRTDRPNCCSCRIAFKTVTCSGGNQIPFQPTNQPSKFSPNLGSSRNGPLSNLPTHQPSVAAVLFIPRNNMFRPVAANETAVTYRLGHALEWRRISQRLVHNCNCPSRATWP